MEQELNLKLNVNKDLFINEKNQAMINFSIFMDQDNIVNDNTSIQSLIQSFVEVNQNFENVSNEIIANHLKDIINIFEIEIKKLDPIQSVDIKVENKKSITIS